MRIAAVVQARMGSERLPGKVLAPLAGRPALAWVIERLSGAREVRQLIVATSTDAGDDPVAAFCSEAGIAVHRGPLEDVAARFGEVVENFGLDAFVRISGDSPLIDPALVDEAVRLLGAGHDMASNVHPRRSFPPGQSVEAVKREAFALALASISEPDEREHVTLHLYRHPERFDIAGFAAREDAGHSRLVLDTPEDAERLEAIFAAMERPQSEYGWRELAGLARTVAP